MGILLCRMGADIVVKVVDIVDFNVLAILVILVQLDIHLRHEGVPVHAVAVKDGFIDFFLVIPGLSDMNVVGVCLGILTAL